MPQTNLFVFSCLKKGGAQFTLHKLAIYKSKTEILETLSKNLCHVSACGPA